MSTQKSSVILSEGERKTFSLRKAVAEPESKDLVPLPKTISASESNSLSSKPRRHAGASVARRSTATKKATELILRPAQDDGASHPKSSRHPGPIRPINPVPQATSRVYRCLNRSRVNARPPQVNSFAEFLEQHARVKDGSGYIPYHFAGREALRPIVERLDQILASGETDASLNLLAYLVAVRFRNVGYYLPDDDLVSGLVDGKLRPDVLDQIPWLARLIAVGKTLNASGRAVNRKGAFLCTDGKQTALAFMRGLGKIPTSFSMDVVVQDEKDDLPEEHARFLAGRMTASDLRLTLLIGTQRYHGAGQNLSFTEGTQHIGLLTCTGCGERVNPETAWPGVCRLEMPGQPSCDWPKLTVRGTLS